MPEKIPFNKPFIAGNELRYIAQAVALGNIGGDGVFTQKCSQLLEQRLGVRRVMMTPSCTAALEMAAMLCDLGPGDEVLMPSYTFVSTANAVTRCGARPVFVDIRPDTLNLDEAKLVERITSRTKAVFPVHYAAVACEMDRIMEIAEEHRLLVVEDAAQAVNAFYHNHALGSVGHLGTYSFHETKNYTCGEGGALCINVPELIERAEVIRDKGTNRRQFFRGEVDKYTWVDVGSSYVPSEIACAFLFGQLEHLDEITQRRRAIYMYYYERLQPLAEQGRLQIPLPHEGRQSNCHMFYVLLPTAQARDALLSHLNQQHIQAVFHYVPLHQSPMAQRLGLDPVQLPVTDDVSRRLLRLPLYYEIQPEQQQRVIDQIHHFFSHQTS